MSATGSLTQRAIKGSKWRQGGATAHVDQETAMHSFCARILGWETDREVVVEHAVRSIELAADHSAALVLLGETDLVPIAYALHRRMLGAGLPRIVDEYRRDAIAELSAHETTFTAADRQWVLENASRTLARVKSRRTHNMQLALPGYLLGG